MTIDIVVYFFIMGFLAVLLNDKIAPPKSLKKTLTMMLLFGIGLKGGKALHAYASWSLLGEILAVICLSIVLCLIAFWILKAVGDLNSTDAASFSAHYGSVSVATFAVAVYFLERFYVSYEPYFPIFLAILEIPAIFVALCLVHGQAKTNLGQSTLKEIILNESIIYLVGAMLIGVFASSQSDKIILFFNQLFSGTLAIFLFIMGVEAARTLDKKLSTSAFFVAFAIFIPILGSVLGGLLAYYLGLSFGGAVLMATLFASASYIAVPAAMSVAIPHANNGQAITASLLITFPFNVIVGINLYYHMLLKLY